MTEISTTRTSTSPPAPAPASQHADEPTTQTLRQAGDDAARGSSKYRTAAIVAVLLVLLVAAVMLDEPISSWAYRIRVFSGIHGFRSILNTFGHGLFTAVLVAVLLVVYRSPRAAVLLGATGLLEGLFSHVIKWAIGRTRPWYGGGVGSAFQFHPFMGGAFGWLRDAGNPSFPSGHAGVAFVNAAFLSLLFPRGRIYFFALAIITAATRVTQGAHWTSDVVGGAILAILTLKLVESQMQRRALMPPADLSLPPALGAWTWRCRRFAALGLLAIVIFAGAIGADRIVTSHETRVALTAQTMAQSGWPWRATPVTARAGDGAMLNVNPWIVPVFQGHIRLQKPPLPYWCAATLMRLGIPDDWAARFVPALLAVLCIPLLIELARRTSNRAAAAIIGWVWISTYIVVAEMRRAMVDPYLTFFVLAAVVAWLRGAGAATRPRWPVIFWFAIALGCMSKGPVVMLHVAIALAAFMITTPRFRPVFGKRALTAHLIGVALLLLITLPWPLFLMRTLPHVLAIWRYESVGEFADNARNARPWWYYGPILAQITLPWIGFVFVGIAIAAARGRRDVRHRRTWFALIWMAATVVFFSFAHMKKAAYLLPMMPAIALLGAEGVVAVAAYLRRPAKSREALLVILRASGAIVVACAGAAIAVVALRYALMHPAQRWVIIGRISVAVAALAAGILACLRVSRAHRRWFEIQAAGVAVLIVLMLLISGAYNPAPRTPYADEWPTRSTQ